MEIKKLLLIGFFVALSGAIIAQSVAINDDGSNPNSNAILDIDISSNDKGILIPRLTTAQRTGTFDDAFGATEEGLTVYDETTNCYWLWDGAAWEQFTMGNLTASGAANHVAYWSDANTIAHDQDELIWDETNHRMGIGVAVPTAKVDVLYTSTTTGDQAAARIELTRSSSNNNDNIGLNLISQNTGLTSNAGEVIALKSYAKAGTSATNSSGNSYGIYNESYSYMNNAYGLYSITETVGDEEDDLIETYGAYLVTKNNSVSSKTHRRQLWGIYNNIETPGMENTYGMHTKIKRQQVGAGNYTSKNIYGSYIDIDGGSNTTNAYGIYSTVTGATNNYAAYFGGGNVGIGTLTPQATLDVSGQIAVDGVPIITSGGTDPYLNVRVIRNISTTMQDGLWINYASTGAANAIRFFTPGTTERMIILSSGRVGIGTTAPDQLLSVNGNASKVGGGTWAAFSDARLKTDINEFPDGLDVLLKINPVSYKYNGLGGISDTESEFIGVIAQEIQEIAPYTVSTVSKPLNENDKENTDLLMYDASALTYILVNSVQEQQTQIDLLIKQNQELIERINKLENK